MSDVILRTPDERFAALPDFPWKPHSIDVGGLRVAYLDEGPRDASPVLLLHGEPSWSFLYRKMIPGLLSAGHRVVAPDLVGFGRSDKPANRRAYTYQAHVDWMRSVLLGLDLRGATLFCQDLARMQMRSRPSGILRDGLRREGGWRSPESTDSSVSCLVRPTKGRARDSIA